MAALTERFSFWYISLRVGFALLVFVIYHFRSRSKREKLRESFQLDPRVHAPFSSACHVFEVSPEANRWLSFWLWMGVVASVIGLVMGFVFPEWFFLWALGLGLAAYDYFIGVNRRMKASPIASIVFHPDHLILVDRTARREVFVFGPEVSFTVDVKEIIKDANSWNPKLAGWECFIKVSDGNRERSMPLSFPGAAEFLARCRHEGSSVLFSCDCSDWLVDKFKSLPCWQPGYFDKPFAVSDTIVELICHGCGGAAHYAPDAAMPVCCYCGSTLTTRQ